MDEEKKKVNFNDVMRKASARAFRGGVAGFAAGVIQVGTFMWMRTAMNYQYANGGTMLGSIKSLYKDCLLYTSPSPRDATLSRMPSSA